MRLIFTLDDTDSKKRDEHKAITLCCRSQMTRKDAMTQWTHWVLAIAIIPQQPQMDCHSRRHASCESFHKQGSIWQKSLCRLPFLPKSNRNCCTIPQISHAHECDRQERSYLPEKCELRITPLIPYRVLESCTEREGENSDVNSFGELLFWLLKPDCEVLAPRWTESVD